MTDLSASLLNTIAYPTFAFSNPYGDLQEEVPTPHLIPWPQSSLNPKNRVDSLDVTGICWRIDGATALGTRFYATYTSLIPIMPPLRIDVYIPEQKYHPPDLRAALDSSYSVCLKDARVASLGIAKHISRALDYCSKRMPQFSEGLIDLPFGSSIQFENVSADVKDMRVAIVSNHELERRFLSVRALQQLWQDEHMVSGWPEIIDLGRLRLQRQIHDSISLVTVSDSDHRDSTPVIFKSTTHDPKHLYHELKVLLTMPPHPNIISRPLYIVTKQSRFGGKRGVCGFILPYHAQGSLRDNLPRRRLDGSLDVAQQLQWARQVTSALIHIREQGGRFYPDLRPDNILLSPNLSSNLSSAESRDDENIILVDFEQRGNWYAWCAPEILHLAYLEHLASFCPNEGEKIRFQRMLRMHLPSANAFEDKHTSYDNPPNGYYSSWLTLSTQDQEAAEVFSLGLLLYCIFEGSSNLRSSVWTSAIHEPSTSFPAFERTPYSLQACIQQCTADAPEWHWQQYPDQAPTRFCRKKDKLFGKGLAKDEEGAQSRNLRNTAREWWLHEIRRMESHFRDQRRSQRPTLRDILACLNTVQSEAAY